MSAERESAAAGAPQALGGASDARRRIGGLTRKELFAGTGASAAVSSLASPPADAAGGRRREHWIAAVPVDWNIVPTSRDAIEDRTFTPAETLVSTVVFREFSPGWKRQLRPPSPGGAGIQGPLIRARVGDSVLVHFKNMDDRFNRPHSMHFHGVEYEFGSDGAFIPGFSGPGADVQPGESFTYRLRAGRGSAGVWPYHDHSRSMMDSIRGGLYGALSIAERGARSPDREFVVFFGSMGQFMTGTDGGRATGARSTPSPSGRLRASPSGSSRTCPACGCTTATSRAT